MTGIHRLKRRKRSGGVDSPLQSLGLDFEEKSSDLPSLCLLFHHAGLVTQHGVQVGKITPV